MCHSTTTTMRNLTYNIFTSSDKNLSMILISLYYSKAFDISQSSFKTYQWRRSQLVYLNNKCSYERFLISGVTQGSILGPLLFLLYTSDIPNVKSPSDVQLYADDTLVLHYFDTTDNPIVISQSINNVLDRIAGYSRKHNQTLNENNTSSVLLSSRNKRLKLGKNMAFVTSQWKCCEFFNTSKYRVWW